MKTLAIIPARGGSKGIPKKNIVRIAGKPLVAWTIESAKRSHFLDRIIVSSDDSAILAVAQKYNSEIIRRPPRYAGDRVPAYAVVLHVLEYLRRTEGYVPDIIVLLQPTSPLRTFRDIDGAITLLAERRAGAVISVAEGDNKCLKSFFMQNKVLSGIVNNKFPFKNRQDLPKVYVPNGAVYVIRTKDFQRNKEMFAKKTLGFLMGKERSIDLDSPEDIPVLADTLKKMRRHAGQGKYGI